jgi:hypothetical protein
VRDRSTAGANFPHFRHDVRRRSDHDMTSFCLECEILLRGSHWSGQKSHIDPTFAPYGKYYWTLRQCVSHNDRCKISAVVKSIRLEEIVSLDS